MVLLFSYEKFYDSFIIVDPLSNPDKIIRFFLEQIKIIYFIFKAVTVFSINRNFCERLATPHPPSVKNE